MPKRQFKNILRYNKSLKRLALSYIEGAGNFGLKIPQIPGGPIITIWSITHKCNLSCNHCYVPQTNELEELSYKDVIKIIDQLSESKNLVLGLSGGEPLLHKDIFKIIEYASKKRMTIALASNAILIDEIKAKDLANAGVEYIQVSIDGLQDVHDAIRGKGAFNKAINGIKNCIKVGIYVSMDVVITKLNVVQIHDLIELAKSLKVQEFEILDFVPSENACLQAHLALTPKEIELFGANLCYIWKELIEENYPLTLSYKNPIFTRILAQRFPNIFKMPFFKGVFPKDTIKFFNFSNRLHKGIFGEQTPFSPFVTGCESGIYVIHIKPNGDVTPCPLNPIIIGNLKKDHIQNIWLQSSILNAYRNLKFEGQCGKCIYRIICGGCRAKVFITYHSYIQSDPTCLLVLNKKRRKKNRKSSSSKFDKDMYLNEMN
ncbi:MAG: radical SAM protein [Promethearchaeota archaeon]